MYQSISMPEFYQLSKKKELNIVDVREDFEYAAGHVPGAQFLPLSEFGERFEALDKKETYYLICQSGSRSAMAAAFLGDQGYQAVNVMGGTGAFPGELAK